MRFIFLIICTLPALVQAKESTCYGTTLKGRLDNSIALPSSGANYVGYSLQVEHTYIHK